MKEKTEKIYNFTYKNISCEIVFWTTDYMKEDKETFKSGGIWNSYFFVRKKDTKELFNKFNLRLLTSKLDGRKWSRFNYYQLEKDGIIEIQGGITFYEKHRNERGEIVVIQIGNDYNHIWNTGFETVESIKSDLEETIDHLLDNFKEYEKKK